ncbi:aminoglycoside phosphotransferase family protein [Solitalea sp. MAHUQ-68]|uniref:Aminoglycoside phosphotransferase family protein n=1 Tax=Solitalea agri TaxID=2953739 RepID=A0A9X2F0G1_9SPHI|nr:aminoglycoside phosphotransferase family protein [Solitalea agri]MCO4292412.1 aminoglycoside phosphotransferase family protein [Solitalea agri]
MNLNQQAPRNIEAIIDRFNLEGRIIGIKPYGSGHINDTYFLKNEDDLSPNYLLQRINHSIFTNVPDLMKNIQLVIDHLKSKLSTAAAATEVLTIVPLHDGELFYKDEDGNYWRVFHFINDTNSYDLVEKEVQANEGGKAFGRFQAMLADMDASLLTETIPNFHNIEMRLNRFYQALENDSAARKHTVSEEIEYINARTEQMKTILKLGRLGKLPLRITHNDTKFNNVLLNKNDEVQCVIDLDTVMPGFVAYDFGDAIRTIINSAAEDEKELDKIKLNIHLFEAYAKGYLKEAHHFLTDIEVESLMHGVLLIPYMQSVRFLTDYLEGDVYYKISFKEHNLQRTKAQIKLLKEIEAHAAELSDIVNTVYSEIKSEIAQIS